MVFGDEEQWSADRWSVCRFGVHGGQSEGQQQRSTQALQEPFFCQAQEDMNEPETGLGARGKWGKDWGCRAEGSNPKYSMGTA